MASSLETSGEHGPKDTSLQSCEGTNFSGLKLPGLSSFVPAAPGHEFTFSSFCTDTARMQIVTYATVNPRR